MQDRTELTIPNDLSYLPAIGAYVKAIAAKVGFSEQETNRIRLAADEACTHVIETAFEPGEKNLLRIICEESDVGLRVIVADTGMPFNPSLIADYDPAAGLDRELGGLGFFLMKRLMDEVHFVSKGPEGKELHLIKYLESGSITNYFSDEELSPYEADAAKIRPAPPGSYEFRTMEPAEAIEVAKCVYKTYGYTYPGEHIYYPERLIAMNENGQQISLVAVSDTGEVAGHCAIFGGDVNSPIRELGQAAVDPAHRSRGLLTRLLQFAIDYARDHGLVGLFGEPVTNHLYSQKASLKLGFRETALFLGLIPQSVYFKKIAGQELTQRLSLLYSFLPLSTVGQNRLYAPWHHRALLGRLYAMLRLDRELVTTARDEVEAQALPAQSILSTHVMSANDAAHIEMINYGRYATSEIEIKLNELCRKGIACIHLDLPLSNPHTALLCAHFEAMGFIIAGVLPKQDGQDVLRLQYLNVPIDFGQIMVVSDLAQTLRQYIQRQYESTASCSLSPAQVRGEVSN
ncbi:MAG: GNAT family N-acetyltransferase [Chloroflexia bacterium]|nr:GNAT family N-acetyltransferase [Chloroflexia bacterium]